jgi:hypothetical protein
VTGVRLSIRRLLALTVLAALDCGLVRLSLSTDDCGLRGFLTVGLGLSAALVVVTSSSGRLKTFAGGFLWAGVALSLAYGVALFAAPEGVDALVFNGQCGLAEHHVVETSSTATEDYRTNPPVVATIEYVVTEPPNPVAVLISDALIGLPILLVALHGTFVWRVNTGRNRTKPSPGLVLPGFSGPL